MYDRQTFEHEGAKFRFRTEHDQDHGAPWDEEDGHGPISEWERHRPGMGTKPPKAPGELILCWHTPHGEYRTYDFAEACRIARRDGWGAAGDEGLTGRAKAAHAARKDFERMQDWCEDRWHYIGVIVELLDDYGDPMGETASLWGIESDADEYLNEVAKELAEEILAGLEMAA